MPCRGRLPAAPAFFPRVIGSADAMDSERIYRIVRPFVLNGCPRLMGVGARPDGSLVGPWRYCLREAGAESKGLMRGGGSPMPSRAALHPSCRVFCAMATSRMRARLSICWMRPGLQPAMHVWTSESSSVWYAGLPDSKWSSEHVDFLPFRVADAALTGCRDIGLPGSSHANIVPNLIYRHSGGMFYGLCL